jgi:hypothetical protein
MEPNDQYLCIVPGNHSTDPIARKDLVPPIRGRSDALIIPEQGRFLLPPTRRSPIRRLHVKFGGS